ncbi:hypothetical protein [Janibacter anophelis]|uniref:hypothetical protein n=1 Tax=Janibacter anophelis TaxID=319054 RepID=UPI000832CAE7|nr:hypothetical protein [Janibacter anophelis]
MGRTLMKAVTALAVTAVAVAGCGRDEDSAQEGSDMMRERTVEAFEGPDPDLASFAGDDETRPDVIDTPFVDDWYVFQLTGQHRATVVAVTKEGEPRGVELTGAPEAWDEVVEGVSVTDATTAQDVADAWVRAMRPVSGAAKIITSVDDIDLTGSQADEVREELRREVGDTVGDTSARATGEDWASTRWMVHDNDLVKLELTIHADATVDVERSVERADLPGPIAL